MPISRRAALVLAVTGPALAVVTAQAPLLLESALLLPTAPSIGPLRFMPDGACSLQQPEPLDAYASLSPIHQQMLRRLADHRNPDLRLHGCWLDPVSPAVAAAFNAAIQGPPSFQPTTRWSSTATQPGGLGQGDPTVLRVSFVPDGTFIPSGVGEGAANSNLFASFNAAFPSQATWQNRILDALNSWAALSGTSYVLEPNDDGAALFLAPGVIGVRGDIRICGKFIDGGGNVLAYNLFPNGGDMVLDTGDTAYFSNPSNNYRRLYNTASHEHGHGLGIDHVCPVDGTKLMEPFLNTNFAGPQYDDMLSSQRLYGDDDENNDTLATATDLGILPGGTTTHGLVSLDGLSDLDYYQFTIAGASLVTITLHPTGTAYLEGPQVGACSGTLFNPAVLRNLAMILQNSTGTTTLAAASSQPPGSNEVISNLSLGAGTYTVRVSGDFVDQIQSYELTFGIVDNGPMATATSIGTGCGGLTWLAVNRPVLGTTHVSLLTGIANPTSSIGLVLIGYSQIPGGLDLGALGAPTCNLYVNTATIQIGFPLTTATYVWTLPIPNTPSLVGSVLDTQGATLVPPGTNALGALAGNAVELVVGTH